MLVRVSLLMPFALAAACAPSWPSNLRPGDLGRVKAYLSDSIRAKGVEGVSIALVDDQSVLWAEGFGLADVAAQRPADADTLYQVGSITKVLTAAAVMQLVEQGRVGLDQPVTDFVPELAIQSRFAGAPPITVRALLAHHSGLPSDVLKGMWDASPPSLAAYIAQLGSEHLVDPPQHVYRYSNVDYSVLGRLIENVEGRDYASAMQARFDAWAMRSTSLVARPELASHLATGYSAGVAQPRLPLRDVSAGGVLSSVDDLARFLSALFAAGPTSPLLSAESQAVMLTQQFPGLPMDFGHRVGLAWMLSGLALPGGTPLVYHDGGYPPFQSVVAMLPGEKLGVVILSNSAEASKFLNSLAIDSLELLHELKTGEARPTDSAPSQPVVSLPGAQLDAFAGQYVTFNGQPTLISHEGDGLAVTLFGQRLTLVPSGPDTFVPHASAALGLVSVPLSTLAVQFQSVEGRDFAVLRGLPAPFAFERIPKVTWTDAWLGRLGPYGGDSSTLYDFTSAALRQDGDLLVLDLVTPGGTGSQALRPISDEEAVVVGTGSEEGNTLEVRATDAGGEELVLSGFHFKR